jgi:hypothetical protein
MHHKTNHKQRHTRNNITHQFSVCLFLNFGRIYNMPAAANTRGLAVIRGHRELESALARRQYLAWPPLWSRHMEIVRKQAARANTEFSGAQPAEPALRSPGWKNGALQRGGKKLSSLHEHDTPTRHPPRNKTTPIIGKPWYKHEAYFRQGHVSDTRVQSHYL